MRKFVLFAAAAVLSASCTTVSRGEAQVPREARLDAKIPVVAYVPFNDLRVPPDIAGVVGVQAGDTTPGISGGEVPNGAVIPLPRKQRLQEPARVQEFRGGRLSVKVRIYAIEFGELDLMSDYTASLRVPTSGQTFAGRITSVSEVKNLSKSIDMIGIDGNRTAVRIGHGPGSQIKEINSNSFHSFELSLHTRSAKLVFEDVHLKPGDRSFTVVLAGNQRERQWTFEFVD